MRVEQPNMKTGLHYIHEQKVINKYKLSQSGFTKLEKMRLSEKFHVRFFYGLNTYTKTKNKALRIEYFKLFSSSRCQDKLMRELSFLRRLSLGATLGEINTKNRNYD
jgi:hypothetical protein